MQERIQKILAHGGIASRRSAEELIRAGRVRVNGVIVTELGAKANPRYDKVEVDGKRVVQEGSVYIVLHKPRGVVSTMSDPEGRPSIKELLSSIDGRVYPVGRLDFATSGVLLVTNDGEMHDGLLHPRKSVPKTYVLKVKGVMKPEDLEQWRKGIRLEDGMTLPAQAKLLRHEGDKTWLELTIREGRNQQIRRMGEASGFPVMRLARVAFAEISAEGLAPGRWRHLTREELQALKKEYGVPKSLPAPVEEQPTKRIQARAVHVRGAAVKGAAGRAQRNLGAEAPSAAPRFARKSEGADENWGSDARDGGGSDRGAARGESRGRADSRGAGASAGARPSARSSAPRGESWGSREGGGAEPRGPARGTRGAGGRSDSRGAGASRGPAGESRGRPDSRGRSDSRGAGGGESRGRPDSRGDSRGGSRGAGDRPTTRGSREGGGESRDSRGSAGGDSRGGGSRSAGDRPPARSSREGGGESRDSRGSAGGDSRGRPDSRSAGDRPPARGSREGGGESRGSRGSASGDARGRPDSRSDSRGGGSHSAGDRPAARGPRAGGEESRGPRGSAGGDRAPAGGRRPRGR